jgi:hypothetical protein
MLNMNTCEVCLISSQVSEFAADDWRNTGTQQRPPLRQVLVCLNSAKCKGLGHGAEPMTLNQRVQGSSPCAPTSIIKDLGQKIKAAVTRKGSQGNPWGNIRAVRHQNEDWPWRALRQRSGVGLPPSAPDRIRAGRTRSGARGWFPRVRPNAAGAALWGSGVLRARRKPNRHRHNLHSINGTM